MNLSEYTIEQLVELKNEIKNRIYGYKDGYFYICNVRSYGRNWKENINNKYTLQELCYRYNGDDGIVDVYTTNPNLKIEIYGNVFYIESVEDYNKWKNYHDTEIILKDIEESLIEWENSENKPFNQRPYFKPYWSRDELNEKRVEFENLDKDFIEPKLI
jgi:hypothetical protein